MLVELGFFRSIGRRRGGHAKAAIDTLCDEVKRLQAALAAVASAPNAYHPDPQTNAEVAAEAAENAAFDAGAGVDPGWHKGDSAGEVARLQARVRELEAPGECRSLHKLRDLLRRWLAVTDGDKDRTISVDTRAALGLDRGQQ